jgi:hypothetical protein
MSNIAGNCESCGTRFCIGCQKECSCGENKLDGVKHDLQLFDFGNRSQGLRVKSRD